MAIRRNKVVPIRAAAYISTISTSLYKPIVTDLNYLLVRSKTLAIYSIIDSFLIRTSSSRESSVDAIASQVTKASIGSTLIKLVTSNLKRKRTTIVEAT